MDISKKLIVIGSGGHSRVVIEAALLADFDIYGIIDTNYKGQVEIILGISVIGGMDLLNDLDSNTYSIAVAVGNNSKRAELFHQAMDKGFNMPTIIHPKAVVSEYCDIGTGVFINTSAIINAGAIIGNNTLINTGSIIDHEVSIGNHSHVCPGVKIGGRAKVGKKTTIGIGSSIIDKVLIGDKVTIGAGSVIIRDVKSNATIVGVPGKQIK